MHGIATMIATKTVKFSDKEIEDIITSTTQEMLFGYKNKKEE